MRITGKGNAVNLATAVQYITSQAKKDKEMKERKAESQKLAKDLTRLLPGPTEDKVQTFRRTSTFTLKFLYR